MQPHGIHIHSHFVQHGRRGNPLPAFVVQAMDAARLVKQCERQLAHLHGVCQVYSVAARRLQQYILPVRFQLAMRARVLVILGGHLRQNAVAQTQRRVTKTL